MIKTLLMAAAVIATPAVAAPRDNPDVQLQKLLKGRVAGAPVNCIDLSRTTTSEIIDGRAIVYRVGSKLYVNEPQAGAESLNSNDVQVSRTFGSQLCSTDTLRMVDRSSGFMQGIVFLNKFVPYSKPPRG